MTPKEKLWFETFVESRSAISATKVAYENSKDKYAVMLSYKIPQHLAVGAALNLYFGRDFERERFFASIQRKIMRGKIGIADIEGIKLVCKERGWDVPSTLPPGKNGYVKFADRPTRRVTETDSQARILKAEPVSSETERRSMFD